MRQNGNAMKRLTPKITDHRTRRLRGDLIHIFKMFENRNLLPRSLDERTRGHSKKLMVQNANTNPRKHSFAMRNITAWNNLPANIVDAENLDIFKSRIDVFLNIHS